MPKFTLNLKDRSYPVLVGPGLLRSTARVLKQVGIEKRAALVVSQKEVLKHHRRALSASLRKAGIAHSFFSPRAGRSSEALKSQQSFLQLLRRMASHDGKNRPPFLIALGGGVVGDLTGFAAAVYRRGIPYLQLPTTLTAQVDSAIGGKTAIDLPEGKNLLGVIHQPRAVICDTRCLETMPERHWSDGFAEVIKYGVIQDRALFRTLENKSLEALREDTRLLEQIIFRCGRIKARIVEKDEYDTRGIRSVLNFGHTAGHAIEAAAGYSRRYTHGQAVAIGMLVACEIADQLDILKDPELTERLERTLSRFGLPLFYKNLEPRLILKAMGFDKKSGGGKNRFVLPVRIAETRVVSGVPAQVILKALARRRA